MSCVQTSATGQWISAVSAGSRNHDAKNPASLRGSFIVDDNEDQAARLISALASDVAYQAGHDGSGDRA
jgi:hypothetical protein